jgi:hypothetical protein
MQRSIEFILRGFGLLGVRALTFQDGEGLEQRDIDYEGLTSRDFQADKLSYLGTPVFDPVSLKSQDGNISIELDAILTELSMSKNIVTTAIQGRNGTVKEYIADGDYNVVFRGVIVGQDGDYPQFDVSILRDLVQLPEALICESDFLRLFGVNNIVVQTYSFPQREGFLNTQLFELQCLSDEPIELIIENEEAI